MAYLEKAQLHFSESFFTLCYKDKLNSWNYEVARQVWEILVTPTAGAKPILKWVHRLLQNKCFHLDLFIVEKAKNAAHDGCLIQLSFFSILRSQNYFLYDKSCLHNSSTIVKLYLSHLPLQSCNNKIYVVYVPRKSIKGIKMWMPHILAECLNKIPSCHLSSNSFVSDLNILLLLMQFILWSPRSS